MTYSWDMIFNRAFNQIMTVIDDGSGNTYQNVCLSFPSYSGVTLPDMGTQGSSSLNENPSGSSNGGIGGK